MSRLNCWEFKKCGQVSGSNKEKKLGACPSFFAAEFDGINSGKNGGRCCWGVSSTLCNGKIQDSVEHKIDTCLNCDFYRLVCTEEESETYINSPLLRV